MADWLGAVGLGCRAAVRAMQGLRHLQTTGCLESKPPRDRGK